MSSDWWDTSTAAPTAPRESQVEESYELVVLDGPEKGLRLTFQGTVGARLLVGKSPACGLRLRDPSVSRRHAAFEVTAKGLRVTDLDSTNGTSVNGVTVVEAYVASGDRLRMSGTTLGVEKGKPTVVTLTDEASFGRMLGQSRVMRRIYPLCGQLAASELPVVIEGETGTGKEVLAEALHEKSARGGAGAPFIIFDCTAMPPTLAESTLFGHERGAFTGAVAARMGVFEAAHGGTLFIDEIGELDLTLQPKLLRALERSEVQRVGSNQWTRVNVRVIAATRRDLDREVQAGRFRDDLFFRLAVGRIELPPLRARTGDVSLLTRHFWSALAPGLAIPAGLLARFEDYPWPGNVRELHNAVARAIALGDLPLEERAAAATGAGASGRGLDEVPAGDLIERILGADLPLTRAREELVGEFERRYVARVLERHGGNVARAAEASGLARRYFQLLRARYKEPTG